MGWVVTVWLLFPEQVSRMLAPGLGCAIEFVACMLVLLSRIVAPEQH
jgi:hypothetical protein